MLGNIPVFKKSEVSLLDVEVLIDIGLRFDLRETLPEGAKFDDIAKYVEDGKSRLRARTQ